ncbi:unnamed protein product [Rhodiola kirilowii]
MVGANGKSGLEEPLLPNSSSAAVFIPENSHISEDKARSISFKVNGITCASCAISIRVRVGIPEWNSKCSGVTAARSSSREIYSGTHYNKNYK